MKIEVIDSCKVTTSVDGVVWDMLHPADRITAGALIVKKIQELAAAGEYSEQCEFRSLLEMLPPTHEEDLDDKCETCGETTWVREWEV